VESSADKFFHLIRYSEIDRFRKCRVLVSVTASSSNIIFPSSYYRDPIDKCPSLPGLEVVYQGTESVAEQLCYINQRRPQGP